MQFKIFLLKNWKRIMNITRMKLRGSLITTGTLRRIPALRLRMKLKILK